MYQRKTPKKAEFSMFFIVAAILGIVTILLLTGFLYKYYTNMKELTAINNCKNSIEAHRFMLSTTVREVFTDIKCPTKYADLSPNNEKVLKNAIAEDRKNCWYMWGEGKSDLFEGDGLFCHICAIYNFKPPGKKVEGFAIYLANTTMINIAGQKNIARLSYQDYLQGVESPRSKELVKNYDLQQLLKDDYIDTSRPYSVIFMYASGKEAEQKAMEGGVRTQMMTRGGIYLALGTAAVAYGVGATATAAVGVIAGAAAINIWNPVGWVLAGGLAVYAGYYVIEKATTVKEPGWIAQVVFRPYDVQEIKDLGCQKIDVNQESHQNTN